MAAMIRSPAVTLILLLVVVTACVISTASYARIVGGRTEIANVKTNDEVQELGRFSVEEYNRSLKLRRPAEAEEEVKFVEVVEAESQVVSGIKYYLRILTTTRSSGDNRIYESVVVVKPWLRSKQLLNFAPSSK
ncbi:hypothetical protein RIF29_41905 [Crotalaria pallida]|uniref:Cystatin domain-containing protein n=1 Tax=Crotalaria pallida TaxID=3830 RepID=A0AAN9E6B8_CROPI